ncbi:hypothetical protein T492DRAFT_881343 [Pavlovales sp. CCMP2436]|nr:hypothetical protein T492DRAFT_881343 [Pavlovales sp. CCMP2436]
MIEEDDIHNLSLAWRLAADPESAARFQRGLLELLKGGSPTRVEHDAYASFWLNCLSKIVQCTSWPIILAAYVKRRKNGEYETCATGLVCQHAGSDALVNSPLEGFGYGAAREIFTVILEFLPGNDAVGQFKKGDGSQQCYTLPSAVFSRALADQSMKVLTHVADAGFVVFRIEGRYETALLLQRVAWKSRLDAGSISAAFANPHDADPFGNGVNGSTLCRFYVVRFKQNGPLALLLYGLATLPDNQSALLAYFGGSSAECSISLPLSRMSLARWEMLGFTTTAGADARLAAVTSELAGKKGPCWVSVAGADGRRRGLITRAVNKKAFKYSMCWQGEQERTTVDLSVLVGYDLQIHVMDAVPMNACTRMVATDASTRVMTTVAEAPVAAATPPAEAASRPPPFALFLAAQREQEYFALQGVTIHLVSG